MDGILADRFGGPRITFWNFGVMALGMVGALFFLGQHSFAGFSLSYMVLFATTGIGNGSTYPMIPSIFRTEALRRSAILDDAGERASALQEASFAIGFIGAIAAYGAS